MARAFLALVRDALNLHIPSAESSSFSVKEEGEGGDFCSQHRQLALHSCHSQQNCCNDGHTVLGSQGHRLSLLKDTEVEADTPVGAPAARLRGSRSSDRRLWVVSYLVAASNGWGRPS